jgi:hypothetical protein
MIRIIGVSLVLCAAVFAQSNRGGIAGTVFDSSGAAVPKATVIVTNTGTNQVFSLTTSQSGAYMAPSLDPVIYRVVAEASGFKTSVVDGVKVDTATVTTVNVTLEPGQVTTEVTVAAETAVVSTESGTTGQTITGRQVQDLPLMNRSVLDLVMTVANVSGQAGSEDPDIATSLTPVPGYNININGGRAGTSLLLADGVNNTGVGIARAIVNFTPETVQEVTVQTSVFSAEFGTTGGGIVNATTKSGSNQITGTALWYNRNPALNAAPFSTAATNRPVSNTRFNQFSFAAGGPVVIPKVYNGHNRTFFFGAIEPRYRSDKVQADTCEPTAAMRNGDFSGLSASTQCWAPAAEASRLGVLSAGDTTIYNQFAPVNNQLKALPAPATGQTYVPFPGNVIPQSMLDPVAIKLLKYVPLGGAYSLDSGGNLANYYLNNFSRQNEIRYTAKIDENITDQNHMSFRATIMPIVATSGYDQASLDDVNGGRSSWSKSQQLMLADTHILSPRSLNDLRLNYTRGRFDTGFPAQWDVNTGENLSTELGLPSLTKGGLPYITFGLNGAGRIGSNPALSLNVEERYNIVDTVTLNRGSMNWKIGVDLTHMLLNTLSYTNASGYYSFAASQTNTTNVNTGTGGIPFASFMLGVPNSVTLAEAALPYYYRWNGAAGFVQNDWKLRPNLTLNLGLRYQLELPRTEKYNHQGVFEPQLAESFALPKPLTLITGQVIASALVPPIAFAGVGGNSKYLWPIQWLNFEPRFGFAWQPRLQGWNSAGKVVVRGGYGISHVPLTGQQRLPDPDFGSGASSNYSENSGQVNPAYATRLSTNPPAVTPLSFSQLLPAVPANGLLYLPSLNYQGDAFAISPNMHTPYSQSWNFTIDYRPDSKTAIEIAYVGNKGTHLFMPFENINPQSPALMEAMQTQNVGDHTTQLDPLGRTNIAGVEFANFSTPTQGAVLSVQRATLASTYLGFNALFNAWDASADSIRHAAYLSFIRRPVHGLTLSANYTFGKSIDDASDSNPVIFATGSATITYNTSGQAGYGGTRAGDRSVSTFDVKHTFNSSFIYDLPLGAGQKFLSHSRRPIRQAVGDWAITGIVHLQSGTPEMVTLQDNNILGDYYQTDTVRPNIVPGVPLINPLWSSNCPVGNLCQPYMNPAAFERPALAQLGNTPRTLDTARSPAQQYFDGSIQKNFKLGESGRRRIQFRMDLINAFNHPVFQGPGNSHTYTDTFSQPATTPITAAQYDAWAQYNGKPLSSTPSGAALLTQAQSLITGNRNASGALPANFFSVPVPQGFALMSPYSFDITTLGGFKLYALRNAYNAGFGQLTAVPNPRYIQLGLKVFF